MRRADLAHFRRVFLVIIFMSSLALTAMPEKICRPTQQDVEGPYYLPGAPFRTEIAGPDEPGEKLIIKGAVSASDCSTSIPKALVEVWQTDAGGTYYYQDNGYRLRGQLMADETGRYEFRTVKPGRYGIGTRGFRPAHIHIKVSHPGYTTLVTQIYFSGDPFLWPNDACGDHCKSNDPERIIALRERKGKVMEGTFDVVLDMKK